MLEIRKEEYNAVIVTAKYYIYAEIIKGKVNIGNIYISAEISGVTASRIVSANSPPFLKTLTESKWREGTLLLWNVNY